MKRFLYIAFFILVVISIRGWFFRKCITYRSAGYRSNYTVKARELRNLINNRDTDTGSRSIEEIVDLSLSITSDQLNFAVHQNSNDPNKLIDSKEAHCVGYASFFAATCNYLLKKRSMGEVWKAQPHIGELYIFGINLHQFFSSPFFKDHDFVTISNKLTGDILAVDPTVHDYLFINHVSFEK
jgi:hypothetical protein